MIQLFFKHKVAQERYNVNYFGKWPIIIGIIYEFRVAILLSV